MKILIAASASRESIGLIDEMTEDFKRILSDKFIVDTFVLPYNFLGNELSQTIAVKLIDIRNECDVLITVDFPACMLDHKKKICITTEHYIEDKNLEHISKELLSYKDKQLCNKEGQVVSLMEVIAKI